MSTVPRSDPGKAIPPPQGGGLTAPLPEPESGDLFDYGLLKNYLFFVLGAMGRHRLLSALVFALTLALAITALKVMPKTYHVDAKLLAQRNQVIAALGNPGRNMPYDADVPLRAATETVLRRDNLVSLARQTDLVANWEKTRAPIVKLRDSISRFFRRREESEDEKLNAMVGLLDKKLMVGTGDGTVTIEVDWSDGQMAFRLVEAALQNFLEARHVSEVSAISEAISILEGHAAVVRERVDQASEYLRGLTAATTQKNAKVIAAATPRAPPRKSASEEQEEARLNSNLREKRRAIADLEESQQKRLIELRAKLAEEREVYSAAHPLVADLQERIDALEKSQNSVQLEQLKSEVKELEDEMTRRGLGEGRGSNSAAVAALSSTVPNALARLSDSGRNEDPALENARGELRFALNKYSSLLDRIDAARLELDAARAAFKYRYSVVRPPEVPQKAVKPNAVVLVMGGVVGGIVLAIVFSLMLDLRRGLVIERWQVERSLDIPVLAEVHALADRR